MTTIDNQCWFLAVACAFTLGTPSRALAEGRARSAPTPSSRGGGSLAQARARSAHSAVRAPQIAVLSGQRHHFVVLLAANSPPARQNPPPARQNVPLPQPSLVTTAVSSLASAPSRVAVTTPRPPGTRVFAPGPASSVNAPHGLRLPKFLSTGVPGSGAVAVGPGVGGAYNDPRMECVGDCSETIPPGRSQSTVREALAGASAAGVGAGVVLLLTAPTRAPKSYLTPAFGLGIALQKFSTSAVWTF